MSRSLTSRLCAIAITVFSTVAMLAVSFEAEAQRRLGGGNFGRQSSNVTQMRTPATPPAANSARTAQGQPNTPAAAPQVPALLPRARHAPARRAGSAPSLALLPAWASPRCSRAWAWVPPLPSSSPACCSSASWSSRSSSWFVV
ncbi:hypothetical protein [Verticiella alkaliphila]|uniref:hypothetical protein n=1 Tax=Verticiella alkaliphila TaxID=2779529 RepID=UPI0035302FFB